MPKYQIQAPDGNTYEIVGPAGASDDQVREQVLKQHPEAGTPRNKDIIGKETVKKYAGSAAESIAGAFGLDQQKGRTFGEHLGSSAVESLRAGGEALDVAVQPSKWPEAAMSGLSKIPEMARGAINIASDIPGAVKRAGEYVTSPEGAGDIAGGLLVGGPELKAAGELGSLAKAGAKGAVTAARGGEEAVRARQLEKGFSEQVQRHKTVAKDVGLPPSDDLPGPNDLETSTRAKAKNKLYSVIQQRKIETDPKWEKYRAKGAELEAKGDHFVVSQPGADLMSELRIMELGGSESETIYTDAERAAAKKLREALSGLDKGDERAFPVSLDVVDKELRHLRALQFDAGQEGYSSVVHDRYRSLYDRVNNALEQWVGKENYPRAHYTESSKEFNKWGTKLGRALTGEQDLDYLGKGQTAPSDYEGKVTRKLFSSRESVKEGIGLLGRQEMADTAARYLSNGLRKKNAVEAMNWLSENQWLSEFPELNKKAGDYALGLIKREGSAEAAAKWRKWAKIAGYGALAGAAGATGFEAKQLFK